MKQIRPFFEKKGITEVGAISFESALPLLDCRAKGSIPKNAKSVIVSAFPYEVNEQKERNISFYASVPDYHNVVKAYLDEIIKELSEKFSFNFVAFVDNSPIREVDAGVKAGIGVKGKNSLLINKKYGSFVFLGTIVTDMELKVTEKKDKTCLNCDFCKKACPSGCISDGGVKENLCLSKITQKKGELSEEEKALVKENSLLWGCDVCQTVCPMNKKREKTPIKEFNLSGKTFLNKEDLTKEEIKDKPYGFRGEKPLLRNYEILYK